MKILKIEVQVGERKGKITLLEGEPLTHEGVTIDKEEREYELDLLKSIFGDWDHPQYEYLIKKEPNYRSFDLVFGSYEEKKEESKSKKRVAGESGEEEAEFPFLEEDEVQCKGVTKGGNRCKREPLKSGYCSLHQPKGE